MSRGWASGLLREEGGPAPTPTNERTLQAVDYLRAPFNHLWWTLVPFLLTVAVATVAAFAMPKRYTTSCLVLVKASQVPDKILTNAAQELDARRHQNIQQEILSRTRLERVNDELQPYPNARTVTVALEAMQAATEVNFKGSDAFTIEFTHRDPLMATNVTNRIASLFIEEFRRSRQSQFEGATEFLDAELQEARHQLDTKEETLRRYKEHNMGRLPQQLPATLSTLQRLQLELQGVEANLDAAEARLERLTSRVAPDVPATAAGLSERESLELELARLRLRYTGEHPDVRELQARLRSLEDQPPSLNPDAAQMSITATQLKRAQAEVAALAARRESLRKGITTQQAHVEQMPRTEQDLGTLTRDFTQLRDNYEGLLRRRMDAQMAVRLQQRWTEDFDILDPARLPERHSFPNQPLFILGGIILGMGVGLGAALLAEVFSGCVLSLEDLEATVHVPVLAVLPVFDSRDAAAASRHRASRRTGRGGLPSGASRQRSTDRS